MAAAGGATTGFRLLMGMYTRCPHCRTVFAVAAEQLKAARGNVRCGTCFESFDAIPYLSDEPGALDATPADTGGEPSVGERLSVTLESVRDAMGEGPQTLSDEPSVSEPAPPLPQGVSHDPRAPVDDNDQLSTIRALSEAESRHEEPGMPTGVLGAGDSAVPEVLREDLDTLRATTRDRRRTTGYSVGVMVLLALLAGQYVWFMPGDAARRYPQWRETIESLCLRTGCELPELRDPERIRVVTRDVRVHPRYEGVLQIKATLLNAAPFRQPYPLLRFTLFNVNGQTIASRTFSPNEYLGRPVEPSARLRPQTSFQVALDLLAPEEAAVSFELQFL